MAKLRSVAGQRRGYQSATKYMDRWPFTDNLKRDYAPPTGLLPYREPAPGFTQNLTASLSFVGSQTKRANKFLSAALSFVGTRTNVGPGQAEVVSTTSFTGVKGAGSLVSSNIAVQANDVLVASASGDGSTITITCSVSDGTTLTRLNITDPERAHSYGTTSTTGNITVTASRGGAGALSLVVTVLRNVTTSGVLKNYTTGTNASQSASVSPSTTGVVVGVGAVRDRSFNDFGSLVADTDTTSGTWSAATGSGTTGGSQATNGYSYQQTKVVTAASTQSYDTTVADPGNNNTVGILFFPGYVDAGGPVLQALSAALSFVGSDSFRTNKSLTATASFTGATAKRTARTLAAALTFVGAVVGSRMFLRSLTATLRLFASSYVGLVLGNSPQAYYRMNDPSGSTMTDASGNGRNGSYLGSPTLGAASLLTGDGDPSVSLNGSSQAAEIADAAWMDQANYTVEALINSTSASSLRAIVMRDNGTTNRIFQFRTTAAGKIEFICWPSGGGGFVVATGATTLSSNTTYHVACTYDGSNARVYLNGVQDGIAALSGSGNTGTWAMQIGAYRDSVSGLVSAYYFPGRIDEVAFYGTALSAGQLLTNANAALSGSGGSFTKRTSRTLAAGVSFVGTQTKRTSKALAAGLSFVGNTAKRTSRPLAAALSFVGSAAKRTNKKNDGELTFSADTLTYVNTINADSPAVLLRLNETSGFAYSDSSGNGHGFSLGGNSAAVRTTAGLLSGDTDLAQNFNGSSDYAQVGWSGGSSWYVSAFTNATWEAVINPDVVTGGGSFQIWDLDGNSRCWQFRIYNSKLELVIWTVTSGGPFIITGATTLTTGTIYHVAATYDGTTAKVFVNGKLDGSSSAMSGNLVTASLATNLSLGRNDAASTAYFDGVIDEAALYTTALSSGKIRSHSNAALAQGGGLKKRPGKTLTAALSFAGSTAKRTSRALSAALSFLGTLGTVFIGSGPVLKDLAASLGFTGGVTKRTSKPLAGSLSFVGAVSKRASKALSASLSFVGVLAKKTSRALSGSLSFAGTLAKRSSRALTASLSFVGSQTRRAGKTLTAALSFAGSTVKRTSRALSGALSFVGSVVSSNTFLRSFTASLSFVGSQTKRTGKALVAALSFAGNATKRTARALAGALSYAGVLRKRTARAIGGALTFAGTITKRTGKILAGGLSFVGGITKRTSRALTGMLSFTGTDSLRIGKALSAVVSFTGTQTRRVGKALAAVLSFAGSLATNLIGGATNYTQDLFANLSFLGAQSKRASRSLTAQAGFSGLITKLTSRSVNASIGFLGSLVRSTRKAIAGALSFVGSDAIRTSRALAASLGFVGAQVKRTTRSLAGSLSFAGAIATGKAFVRSLTGALSFTGSDAIRTNKALAAVLSFTGSQAKRIPARLTAALSFTGSVAKRTSRTLVGGLSFVGSATRRRLVDLAASLGLTGALSRRTSRPLAGALSFVGTATKLIPTRLAATLSFAGSVAKQTRRSLAAGVSFVGSTTTFRALVRAFTASLTFTGSVAKQTGKSLSTAVLGLYGTLKSLGGLVARVVGRGSTAPGRNRSATAEGRDNATGARGRFTRRIDQDGTESDARKP
jgi:Concanavalin A-like lectin/glucanases superfamily